MENPLKSYNHTPMLPLEKELLPLFTKKAPFQMADEWKDVFVKYSPYIVLILVPFSILAIGIGSIVSIFSLFSVSFLATASLMLTILALVLNLIALPGLFAYSRSKGWTFVYYGYLLSTLSNIITLSISNIFTGAIGFVIGGFILFQIRDRYK